MNSPTPDAILRRVDWQIIRRLDGLLQGDYRSLLYGAGVDFADLRAYQPGDDVRYIDWNVTARLGEPYLRQYVEDREVTGWFLLDVSPSLEFGTVTRSKRGTLIDFVATFTRALNAAWQSCGGHPVWLAGGIADATTNRAAAGPATYRCLDELNAFRKRPDNKLGSVVASRGPVDPQAIAGGDRVGLHQLPGLGGPAQGLKPPP